MIIDPDLVFSTFIGGSAGDFIIDVDIAENGDIAVTGVTTSFDFPLSATAVQNNNAGQEDIFVTMLRPDASEIVFSTYLGGLSIEIPGDVAIMADRSISICGATLSADFPTSSDAIDANFNGILDAYVSQLSESGDSLRFSSYIGGSSEDNCTSMDLDAQGRVLMSGYTSSPNFPVTPDAMSTQYQGGTYDGFFSVLRLDQPNIEYSTFLGGSGSEFEVIQFADLQFGIAIVFGLAPWLTTDDEGNVYLAGTTSSADFVTTPGAFMRSLQGSDSAFIMRLDAEDYSLVASTLLGGDMLDGATSITMSTDGKVVVGGLTSSSDFPASSGAFQSAFGGGEFDAFLAVLDSNLQAVEYGTYVGGQGFDVFFADVAAENRIHIGGMTSSNALPSSPDALQLGFGGAIDTYFLTLNLSTNSVEFSTYIGGSGEDLLHHPTTTPDGGVLLIGSSQGLETTSGVIGENYSGGPSDGAIVKFAGRMSGAVSPTVGGIVSSASFLANAPAAPGSILAVFGQNFGMTNRNFLFPSTQFEDEGVSVLFDGTAAPLFGVFGATPFPQINVLAATGSARDGPGSSGGHEFGGDQRYVHAGDGASEHGYLSRRPGGAHVRGGFGRLRLRRPESWADQAFGHSRFDSGHAGHPHKLQGGRGSSFSRLRGAGVSWRDPADLRYRAGQGHAGWRPGGRSLAGGRGSPRHPPVQHG